MNLPNTCSGLSLRLCLIQDGGLISSLQLRVPTPLLLPQTLDQTELQGDGIILSLEEQLNALCLSSSPSPSAPDKDTVSLNGSHFSSHLFESTSESTKVVFACCYFTWRSFEAAIYKICIPRAEMSTAELRQNSRLCG